MSFFDLSDEAPRDERRIQRIYGVVTGLVTNNQDAENLGRVKVAFPWLSSNLESNWARLSTPMAGASYGVYFLPQVGDEVLVAFLQGDPRFPYVLGGLWNSKDLPPATNEDGANNIRMIKSRNGNIVKFNDENGVETIEITSQGSVTITAPNGTLKLAAETVQIEAVGTITVKGSTVNIN